MTDLHPGTLFFNYLSYSFIDFASERASRCTLFCFVHHKQTCMDRATERFYTPGASGVLCLTFRREEHLDYHGLRSSGVVCCLRSMAQRIIRWDGRIVWARD